MAGDSEKRFQKIMDKLYHAPKPKSSISSIGGTSSLARGKRPDPGFKGALEKRSRLPMAFLVPPLGLAPPCRPWERGDLMRRLATFKALTWFGKPKSVSPINCATRGWFNVEMDVISCEACGARLLFPTSSSWTIQQVEKAAAVFSLKLDNGHKLLCPWIDNACDKALAHFPPTPPAALVEGYKERVSMLLQLTGLPVVSSSATDYMKSPQLEHLLSQDFHPTLVLSDGIKLTDGSRSKDVEGAPENVAVDRYYQALKIIGLCGWEPRLLPYAVEREDQSTLLTKTAHPSESSAQMPGQSKHSIILRSSSNTGGLEVGKSALPSLGQYQYDPACIVLDCRFCGACVGLWAFSTTHRPLEFFRLVADFSESAVCSSGAVSGAESSKTPKLGKGNQFIKEGFPHTGCDDLTTKERPMGLNFTIAGGPTPTRQSFRPRVSFPIISRHLRSGGLVFESERLGKRKRSADEEKGSDCVVNEENAGGISSEQGNDNIQETHSFHECTVNVVNSEEVMGNRTGDLERSCTCTKEFEMEVNTQSEADKNVEVEESLCTTSNSNEAIQASEACENKLGPGSAAVEKYNSHYGSHLAPNTCPGETSENPAASCSATNITFSSTHSSESANCSKVSDFQNLDDAPVIIQKASGLENKTLSSIDKADTVDYFSGFDPIWQHRPFCPWIAAEDREKNTPGWKLTLSALIRQEKDHPCPSDSEAPSNLLLDEVDDDPIASVRRLFMSPSAKRLKGSDSHKV